MNETWNCTRPDCPARTHHTYSAYRQGCRSDAARADQARYTREYRALSTPSAYTASTGTARRLQALTALGWPGDILAAHLDCGLGNLSSLRNGRHPRVTLRNARRVRDLYDQLAMTIGPSDRARVQARLRGWAPPLAWDDDLIDDPDETPDLGPRSPRPLAVDPERVAELTAHGRTAAQIAEQLGCSERAVVRVRARLRRGEEAA